MAYWLREEVIQQMQPKRCDCMARMGCLEEGAVFIENLISKDDVTDAADFPSSIMLPAQIAIDQQARGLNRRRQWRISFECASAGDVTALW